MDLLQALVLGLLQGITEVLPISSSAHLIFVPRLFGWPESGLTFDVALHFGTFIALFAYFRRDVATLAVNVADGLKQRDFAGFERQLPWLLVAGSVPAALVGKLFEEQIEQVFRNSPLIIFSMLIVFGLLLGFADRFGRQSYRLMEVKLGAAMIIGCFQCLALIPGVSRSGITITAALLLGFARPDAARFSFLLSLPIVAGAAMLKGVHLFKYGVEPGMILPMLVGVAVAAVSGYMSVAFLLRFVQRQTVWPFVWYRVLVGTGMMVALWAGVLR